MKEYVKPTVEYTDFIAEEISMMEGVTGTGSNTIDGGGANPFG